VPFVDLGKEHYYQSTSSVPYNLMPLQQLPSSYPSSQSYAIPFQKPGRLLYLAGLELTSCPALLPAGWRVVVAANFILMLITLRHG
jgi:hypothetical protein